MLNITDVTRIYLGIQGENEARPITINVHPWLIEYPSGSVSIWHRRNGDANPQPTGAVFDDEAETVTWTPSSTDTYVDGEGDAEIRLTENGIIKKSKSIKTGVSPAVTGAGVPLGSDWQSYINEVERIKGLAVSAKQDAVSAASNASGSAAAASSSAGEASGYASNASNSAAAASASAGEASGYASNASGSALNALESSTAATNQAKKAEGYAVGKQNGTPVTSESEYYQNNAKYYAEAAQNAKETVEEAVDTVEDAKDTAEEAKDTAEEAADVAMDAAEDAEAWAIGKRGGEEVQSSDETYENNAKYYAEQTEALLEDASGQIREDVENWLEEHPEATTTVDFTIAAKVFPTVAAMVADITLKNGDNVATRGYYVSGDNGGANYVISSTHSGVFYLTLSNGMYANRLNETGILPAESIGIKAYVSSTANPDSTDMDRNVTLFNTAVYNGIYLLFGKGYFYFSDAVQLAQKNTYTIQGLAREVTHLFFPESDGFYFADPIYYNYYVIRGMHIHSYGNTIVCAPHCLTVLDSHFEWLQLESETGDCFHAPDYNVAKYEQQGGGIIYDTCVQNCVFDFINASAPAGAAFCNIMGMYTYYKHLNFVSCKYAFRNCDGTVEQANNLGTQQDYYIYYDKTNSYNLRWMFINVNAEGLSKAFMYTEPRKNAGEGEDPRKPETANLMKIERFTAINSDWSLYGVSSGHDIYPMTVQEIDRIDLIDSDNLITPGQYPSVYDTNAVKGSIKINPGGAINNYNGGKSIKAVVTGYEYTYLYAGTEQRSAVTMEDFPNEPNTRVPFKMKSVISERYYGGRARSKFSITHSASTQLLMDDGTVPYDNGLFDLLDIKLTTTAEVSHISMPNCVVRYHEVGKIITIRNNAASTKNLLLVHNYNNTENIFYFGDGQNRTLEPGDVIHLIVTMQELNGNRYRVLKQIAMQ